MWKTGTFKINNCTFDYSMKVYEEESAYGIDEGKISKLTLERNGAAVCCYDRGWVIKPGGPKTQAGLEYILRQAN